MEGVDGLADRLIESAGRWARRGLAAHNDGDLDHACADLAIAVEHLAKGYLVKWSPTLIAETSRHLGRDLMMLAGALPFDGRTLRTVGLSEAISRVIYLDADFAVAAAGLGAVTEGRSAALHLGAGHPGRSEVVSALRALAWLVDSIDRADPDSMFGGYVAAVASLLAERDSEVRERVALRIGHAREAWQRKYWGLSDDEMTVRLGMFDAAADLDPDDGTQPYGCPACGRHGALRGEPDLDAEVDVALDDDGEAHVVSEVYRLELRRLRDFACYGCGLRLSGAAELAASGMPAVVTIRELGDSEADADLLAAYRDAWIDAADPGYDYDPHD